MTEAPKRHPAIRHVYDVIGAIDPEATQALTQIETFFRLLAKDANLPREERPKREPPEALDHPIFEQRFPELGGKNPLVTLRAAIDTTQEEESKAREKLEAKTTHKRKKRTPPPPPKTSVSVSMIEDLWHELQTELSSPHPAVDVFVAEPKDVVRQTERKKRSSPPRKRTPRPKKQIEPFTPPSGYSPSRDVATMFPELTRAEIIQAKDASRVNKYGRNGIYYNTQDLLTAAANIQNANEQRAEIEAQKVTDKELATQYGIGVKIIRQILKEEPSTGGINRRRYNQASAEQKIKDYLGTGEGTLWVLKSYFHTTYGVSHKKLDTLLAGVSTKQGVGKYTLYNRQEAMALISPYAATATIDEATGIYTDTTKKQWASEKVLSIILGISTDKLKTFLNPDNTLPIRRQGGMVVTGYDIAETKAAAKKYLEIKALENQQKDNLDAPLTTGAQLAQEYNCSIKSVHGALRSILLDARTNKKHYPEARARALLDEIIKYPEIPADAKTYTDPNGVVYELKYSIEARLHIGRLTTNDLIDQGVIHTTTARKGLTVYTLVQVEDLEEYKKQVRPRKVVKDKKPLERQPTRVKKTERKQSKIGRDYWKEMHPNDRNALIEERARTAIANGVLLSDRGLLSGYSGLRKAIPCYYPGSYQGLRKKLQLEENVVVRRKDLIATNGGDILALERRPTGVKKTERRQLKIGRDHWKEMEEEDRLSLIEERARALVAQGVVLSHRNIPPGHSGLARAIMMYYPGSYQGLRKKLSLEETVKIKRDWEKIKNLPELLRRELQELITNNGGDITAEELRANGYYDAVRDYYPGGYSKLRTDLGLKKKKATKEDMTPRAVIKAMQAFIEEHGKFTTTLAEKSGRHDLIHAARNHYPGGLNKLLTDVGQNVNRQDWTVTAIEKEAAELYRTHGKLTAVLLTTVAGLRMAVARHYPGQLTGLQKRMKELDKPS